jgi:Na+-translocating ferredoxin:NAD+ oxidoreductase RnfD subunit
MSSVMSSSGGHAASTSQQGINPYIMAQGVMMLVGANMLTEVSRGFIMAAEPDTEMNALKIKIIVAIIVIIIIMIITSFHHTDRYTPNGVVSPLVFAGLQPLDESAIKVGQVIRPVSSSVTSLTTDIVPSVEQLSRRR